MLTRRCAERPDAQPLRAFGAMLGQVATAQATELACGYVGLAHRALHGAGCAVAGFRLGAHWVAFCRTRRLRARLSTSAAPRPLTRSKPGPAVSTAFPP